MKILLVQPPIPLSGWFGRKSAPLPEVKDPTVAYLMMRHIYTGGQPVALEMVASCVPAPHEVRILNLGRAPEGALERELEAFRPDLVGVSCTFTCGTNNTLAVVRRVRAAAPETFILLGGHAPSLAPEHFDVAELDAIAIGEGEVILPQLLARLEEGVEWRDLPGLAYRVNGRLRQPDAGPLLVEDLDALPPLAQCMAADPADGSQTLSQSIGVVSTSRGCPFRCAFCAVTKMYGGRYRWMSPERTVQEIESAPGNLVGFLDDSFLANIPRARRIAQLLLERGVEKRYFFQARSDNVAHHPDVIALWQQAGLNDVFLGVESVDDERLKEMHKGSTADINRRAVEVLHRYGVKVSAGLIIEPDFVEEDFDRMGRFIEEIDIDVPYFNVLTPFPGTDLWDQRQHELTSRNWDDFNGNHVILPTKISLLRFYQLCFELATRMWARCDAPASA